MYLFFAFLFSAFTTAVHDFKMSVCEVVYAPSNDNFDVKFYIFTDDLNAALGHEAGAALPGREEVTQYVQQHFSLQINSVPQALTFYSLRQKDEQVLVQFSTPKLGGATPLKIQVKDNLLVEKFREQSNVVYAILPGKSKKTAVLDSGKQEAEFGY